MLFRREDELNRLQERLLVMGGFAQERVRMVIQGLVDRDVRTIRQVMEGDGPINDLPLEIDARAVTLLALHQPMASDLRAVVAAITINTDLERVGDLAVNVAEAADRYLLHPPVKPLIDIPRMADIAQTMLRDALDAFVQRDTELAQDVLNTDDELDALKTRVFRELLGYMMRDANTIEPALDLVLVSRHLERVGTMPPTSLKT